MASITRYDPFNDLVDDFFKGFLVRPVAYENGGRAAEALPRVKVDVVEKNGAYKVTEGLLDRYGPSRDPARWSWVSPGAVLATILLLTAGGSMASTMAAA